MRKIRIISRGRVEYTEKVVNEFIAKFGFIDMKPFVFRNKLGNQYAVLIIYDDGVENE